LQGSEFRFKRVDWKPENCPSGIASPRGLAKIPA
jgi:hypothetical protein